MLRIGKIPTTFVGLLAVCAAFVPAPAFADGDCQQWDVPPTLIVKQWGGQDVVFQLQQEGTSFHGWASYQTTKKQVVGNVSGEIVNDAFYARVLWTYSGVNAIGRYQGKIKPRTEVPVGQTTYGFVFEGYTYDEYHTDNFDYWNSEHFTCHVDAPPPQPAVNLDTQAPARQFAEEKKHDSALGALAAEAEGAVKPQARVKLDGAPVAPPLTPMSTCANAAIAAARNSPAAPGLEQLCLSRGGFLVLEPSLDAAYLETLAVQGGPIVDADPELSALRAQQSGDAGMRGFNIGVAATGHDTSPGPGKQHIYNSLARDERPGYDAAVAFVLERNRR